MTGLRDDLEYNVPIYNTRKRRGPAPLNPELASSRDFRGVISSDGWDSASRLLALGIRNPTPSDKGKVPKFAQTFQGIVTARPLDTAEKKREVTPVPIEQDSMITGVVAAGIALNAIRPMQPYPKTWDVFSSPVGILDSGLEAFRLPDPSRTINQYIAGDDEVEFDETCLLTDPSPTRQRLPNAGDHKSYLIEARAIFVQQPSPVDAYNVIAAAANASDVDLDAFEWSGPFRGTESRVARINIRPHTTIPGAGTVSHTSDHDSGLPTISFDAPDPDIVEPATGVPAIFDLLFYSTDGSRWGLIVTRIR